MKKIIMYLMALFLIVTGVLLMLAYLGIINPEGLFQEGVADDQLAPPFAGFCAVLGVGLVFAANLTEQDGSRK